MQFSKANQWQAKSGVLSSLFICISFLNLNEIRMKTINILDASERYEDMAYSRLIPNQLHVDIFVLEMLCTYLQHYPYHFKICNLWEIIVLLKYSYDTNAE